MGEDSMTEKLTIWGRVFDLRVAFDYYDEPIPAVMTQAAESFAASSGCVQEAYSRLEQYCLENDGSKIASMSHSDGIDNIFRYVMPDYLFVLEPDEERGVMHRVALMCDYRFDPEEGLALIFEDERFKEICPQSAAY